MTPLSPLGVLLETTYGVVDIASEADVSTAGALQASSYHTQSSAGSSRLNHPASFDFSCWCQWRRVGTLKAVGWLASEFHFRLSLSASLEVVILSHSILETEARPIVLHIFILIIPRLFESFPCLDSITLSCILTICSTLWYTAVPEPEPSAPYHVTTPAGPYSTSPH